MMRAQGSFVCVLGGALSALGVAGCPQFFAPGPEPIELEFDFAEGDGGFEADVSDYPVVQQDNLDFEAGIRALPEELGLDETGLYVQSNNSSDDLFTFIKRRLGPEDGLTPNTEYAIEFTIVFASNVPSGCAGVGGSPGESVYLKAGAASVEPVPSEDDTGEVILNVDKGQQANGGDDASVVGTIGNGQSEGCDDLENADYISLTREHAHPSPVRTNEDGELWIFVGTDSGFESVTALYYQRISVRLTPQ